MPYLHLDRIKHDLQVERLLPPEVARQYHALPISFDGHQVTVAMSSPGDPAASTMISSSIGRPVYFVRADLSAIDQRLAEIWPGKLHSASKLLVWNPGSLNSSPAEHAFTRYAQNVAELLQAVIYRFQPPAQPKETLREINIALAELQPDLLIVHSQGEARIGRASKFRLPGRFLTQLPVSTLTANSTRWPLQKILLVLTDSNPGSNLAIEWTGRFARPSHAEVTILPVLPPIPPVYGAGLNHNITGLLTAKDPFGQTARRIAEHFSDIGIQAAFRLRQGDPADQLLAELAASDPDLVILAAENPHPLHRALAGSLLKPVWSATKCPVLTVRDTQRAAE